jgi:chemotaxis protein MotB
MAKRKKHHEEHIDETWLIPYADMLTLLLALFIVLFAVSSVDAHKFEQMAKSFNIAFTGGEGIMEFPSPTPTPDTDTSVTKPLTDPTPDRDKLAEEAEEIDLARQQDFLELLEIKKKIDQYIEENKLALSLQTDLTQEGILITIMDNALFSPGSAEIKPGSRQLALEISKLLVTDPPRHVTVAGHTDNVPINTPQFRSNWDLSAMRAINFMKVLLENDNLAPNRFSSTAYGEYRPVATNTTSEGRAKNRRVEVLILPYSDVRSQN